MDGNRSKSLRPESARLATAPMPIAAMISAAARGLFLMRSMKRSTKVRPSRFEESFGIGAPVDNANPRRWLWPRRVVSPSQTKPPPPSVAPGRSRLQGRQLAELPEQEAVNVGPLAERLLRRAADPVPRLVVEAQQHWLAACAGCLQASRGLAALPDFDARVVHAMHQQDCGIGDAVLD